MRLNYDQNVQYKLNRYQQICGATQYTLKRKARKKYSTKMLQNNGGSET
jgi:hypothetical protein